MSSLIVRLGELITAIGADVKATTDLANDKKRKLALMRWEADLANRDNQRALVLVTGDSISEGQGSGALSARWITRMQDQLREMYPTPALGGVYGAGFIPPQYYASGIGQPTTFSTDPTWTNAVQVGLGAKGVNLKANQFVNYPAMPLTSFRLHWKKSSAGTNLYPKVDGNGVVSPISINTGEAVLPLIMQFEDWDVTPGSHIISVQKSNNAFDGFVGGIEFFNGDETSGVHVLDGAKFGSSVNNMSDANWDMGHWGTANLLDPGLIIVFAGANDAIIGRTAAQLLDTLTTTLAHLRVACPTSSVVFVIPYERSDAITEAWANYVAVYYTVAATDPGVCVLDLTTRMPKVADSPNFGLYSDIVHPSVKGHAFLANIITEFISTSGHGSDKAPLRKITSITSSATPVPVITPSCGYTITALASAAVFGIPYGTPVDGQSLIIRIKDNGTICGLTWNAVYVPRGVALPTTTVASHWLTVGFIYNATTTTWDCIASVQEA